MMDKPLRLEVLSALLGDVKISDKFVSTKPSITPSDFVTAAILGHNVLTPDTRTPENPLDLWTRLSLLISKLVLYLGNLGKKKEFFVDMDQFFDPQYDFDFTNMTNITSPTSYGFDWIDRIAQSIGWRQCSRGRESYTRPWGWYRMALKVENKYPDGNTWLGTDGWRDRSAPGEWPVSYHGTSIDGAKGIIQSHYKAGNGDLYGRGVYSTPSLSTAQGYTKQFTSKNGKTYNVIMQNRINSLKREKCRGGDYFLVCVAKDLSPQQEREIVEGAIRPYGILIQEINGESTVGLINA